jgi:putative hemolysin
MEERRLPPSELPPLIRRCLQAGARACGEPARDPQFGSADFPMLVAVDSVNRRVGRHFDLSPDHAA